MLDRLSVRIVVQIPFSFVKPLVFRGPVWCADGHPSGPVPASRRRTASPA